MYGINVAERIADISYDEYVRFIKHLFHTWYYHLKKRTIHNLNSYFVSPELSLSESGRLSLETNHHQSTFSHPFEGSAPHISPPSSQQNIFNMLAHRLQILCLPTRLGSWVKLNNDGNTFQGN